jgi:hypothetical protein
MSGGLEMASMRPCERGFVQISLFVPEAKITDTKSKKQVGDK